MQTVKIPPIRINAEFQRLLWLHGSWGMAAGILMFYGLFLYVGTESPEDFYIRLFTVGSFGCALSGIIYYSQLSRSISSDIAANTFDSLRMTALTPWQMASARIFAAPISAWFTFVLAQLCLLAGSLAQDKFQALVHFYILCTAWTTACVLLINEMQMGRNRQQWSGSILQLLLLFIIAQLLNYPSDGDPWLPEYMLSGHFSKQPLTVQLFPPVLAALLAGFGVRACMARWLHLKSSHPYWLFAALVSPLLLAGFIFSTGKVLPALAIAYWAVSLISLIAQDSRRAVWQRMAQAVENGRTADILKYLPAWVVTFPLGLTAVLFSPDVPLSSYLQLGLFGALVLIASHIRTPHNSITLAMTVYLFIRLFVIMLL